MGGGNGGKRGEVSEKLEKVSEQTQTNIEDVRKQLEVRKESRCV